MASKWELTLAIASDLHCHEESYTPTESWLIAGALRKPAGNHPVQALISLIKNEALRADALICPGDLSNRVSKVGMMQSWDHLGEIQREIKAELLLTTLGNHDVDCHKSHNKDPFYIPRNLHDEFPVSAPTERASFWADGFFFATGPSGSDFLILNTVIAHNDETSAKRGTFDHERIEKLGHALRTRDETLYSKGRYPRRIAILHHHPLLHSNSRFTSEDVLEFGDQLLALLSKYQFRLVIHGHRHDPRITRQSSAANDSFVLAAGSFSAVLKELSTWTRNLFHIVKLRDEASTGRFIGELLTWEYNKGTGWRPSTHTSSALPHVARFCAPRPNILPQDIQALCNTKAGGILSSDELNTAIPDLTLLLPNELYSLQHDLAKAGIKLVLTPDGTVDYVGRLPAPSQ